MVTNTALQKTPGGKKFQSEEAQEDTMNKNSKSSQPKEEKQDMNNTKKVKNNRNSCTLFNNNFNY